MKKHRLASKSEKKGGSSAELPVRYLPLAGVLMGATLLAIGLVCLYVVMRAVGLEHGGTCVSGGPYEIAPGHECESGVFPLAFGGAIGIFVGALLLFWSSKHYGGPLAVASASGVAWTAFWGGLGGSFLSIAAELPASSDTGSEFNTVGIVFLVLSIAGIAVAVGTVPYSVRTERLDYAKPSFPAWLAWFAAIAVAVGIGIVARGAGIAMWEG